MRFTWERYKFLAVQFLASPVSPLPGCVRQFRVLWMLAADQEPVAGPASHAISTLARGRPSSPPSDVTASASDPHHVSVSWRPPRLPGGPVVSYLVQLSAAGGAAGADDLVAEVAGRLTSHVLGELKPSTEYTVKVSARNKEGVGPPAEVLVLTPPLAAEGETTAPPANMTYQSRYPCCSQGSEYILLDSRHDLCE